MPVTQKQSACGLVDHARPVINYSLLGAFAIFGMAAGSAQAGEPRGGGSFSGCGDLVQTTGIPPCLVFASDDGVHLFLSNSGGFGAGDRVYVSGEFDPFSAHICDLEITPTLINTLIEPCFSACGTVLPSDSVCNRLMSHSGEVFALSRPTGVSAGDEAFVTGRITAIPVDCSTESHRQIDNVANGPCAGGFGRLLNRFGCTVFVDRDGNEFDLQHYGRFTTGNYVVVEGAFDAELIGACGRPLILHNTIRPAFGGPGSVVFDADCGLLFNADRGGEGLRYRVEGLDGFAPGDRVNVTGVPDQACAGAPACVAPCLQNSSIAPLHSDCGSIYLGENGCAFFDPLDGTPLRLIENNGNLSPGSFAFVAGSIQESSTICGATDYETIADNLALPCFQGCGELTLGFECAPLFDADDGGIYWLENTGGFHIGDRVYVAGGRGGACLGACPFPCIQANTISYCPGDGDVNRDGFADFNDVAPFVAVILGDDQDLSHRRAADVNGSGEVDAADIQTFTLYVLGF